jgi:phage terminase large subunit-like protein
VLTGQVVDDTYFAYIARIDDARTCEACSGVRCDGCQNGVLPADDPFDEACWPKAQPNLGITVSWDYYREQANEAKHKPTALSDFVRYQCNRVCSSNARAISTDVWSLCGGELSDWYGMESYGAFDLGRRSDLASLALTCKFPDGEDDEGKERFRFEMRQWSFTFEDVDLPLHQEPWATFIRLGQLLVNPGNVIDLPGAFKSKLLEVTTEYNVVQWAYDPHNAAILGIELQNTHGMNVYQFFQSHGHYNETIDEFLKCVKSRRLRHGDDHLLTFAAQNLVINRNHKNEWMPKKDSRTGKIDPIVAGIMSFGGAMNGTVGGYWTPERGVSL